MKCFLVFSLFIYACSSSTPQGSVEEDDFIGYKADSPYEASRVGTGVGQGPESPDGSDQTESEEDVAPGKQNADFSVGNTISFLHPAANEVSSPMYMAVSTHETVERVVYVLRDLTGPDEIVIAESTLKAESFNAVYALVGSGESMIGAQAYDATGNLMGTAWKGIYLPGAEGNGVLPKVVLLSPGEDIASNPVKFVSTTQGDVHSVRYIVEADGEDGAWNLGESFDQGAGFSVSYSFGASGPHTIHAVALNQKGEVLAQAESQFIVEVPLVSGDLLDGNGCDPGQSKDCDGTCVSAQWLGDGVCDDGLQYASNFNCSAFAFDEGDCGDTGAGGICPEGSLMDCEGNCAKESWLSDGTCDDGTQFTIVFDCEEFAYDGGDCVGNADGIGSGAVIGVPYFYQYDNNYYPSSSSQNSALAMVLAYYGWEGVPDVISSAYTNEYANTPIELATVFNNYAEASGIEERLDAQVNGTFQDLKQLLAQGKPVIVHGFFTSGGHVVVVTDYSAGVYTVNDPGGEWNQLFKGVYPFGWNSTVGKGITYDANSFEMAISTSNGYASMPIWYHEVTN